MLGMFFRLLAIASVLMMPLVMTSTPASAAQPDAPAPMACDGHEQPSKSAADIETRCMACVAIVQPSRAADLGKDYQLRALVDPDSPLLAGLQPKVATPPPKRV